mmetsp:Transcript_42650/g.92966  ORF Transcript_42650/g.92966 Transcript_42650/m.92966 type:complete len:222 (+) Transcript_42650:865-1530(+)
MALVSSVESRTPSPFSSRLEKALVIMAAGLTRASEDSEGACAAAVVDALAFGMAFPAALALAVAGPRPFSRAAKPPRGKVEKLTSMTSNGAAAWMVIALSMASVIHCVRFPKAPPPTAVRKTLTRACLCSARSAAIMSVASYAASRMAHAKGCHSALLVSLAYAKGNADTNTWQTRWLRPCTEVSQWTPTRSLAWTASPRAGSAFILPLILAIDPDADGRQ